MGFRNKTKRVKKHYHTKSCKHNFISLENINGKCYKNGRKISCSKFVKEEKNIVKKERSMNNFWDMFKV